MKNSFPTPIKTVIIDDQQLIIDGLMSLLAREAAIEVTGYTVNGMDTIKLLNETRPDVVLMDYRFPGLDKDGIELANEALQVFPNAKFLMLTSYDEFALVKEALKKGIKGYLIKNTGMDELVHAIRQVAAGHAYLGPNVQQKIINTWANEEQRPFSTTSSASNSSKPLSHPLTKRELEIARLYSAGKSRKEIAEYLFISTNTVDTHLKNTFGKLGVKNVAELINYLLKHRLLE